MKGCEGGDQTLCLKMSKSKLNDADYEGAVIFLRNACKNNDGESCFTLAWMREQGELIERNTSQSVALHDKGCRLNER